MERQLRMGGGIMNVTPRQQYGLGSFIKKAVKGVTKGVKKIAGSKLGKAALIGMAGFGIPGTSFNGMFGGGGGLSSFFGKGSLNPLLRTSGMDYGQSQFGSMLSGAKNFLKTPLGMTTAITATSALAAAGVPEDQAPNDLATLQSYLKSGYLKLNPDLDYNNEEDKAVVDTFVQQNSIERMAEGGRIGYGDGSGDMILPMRKPETDKMLTYEEAEARDPQMFVDTTTRGLTRNEPIAALIEKYNTYKKVMPGVADYTKTYLKEDFQKSLEDSNISIEEFNMRLQEQNEMDEPVDMAYGGRMGYAFGTDSPENNAIQAAGIEGLPLNQNPAGVTELDLRDSGGFIPPVGVKEKADDIPAMLANNEFVFTADAVRGMGDGSVNKGAQRMYDMMKKLEKGGRV